MKRVVIEGQINPCVNFAMQQNYVPIIRSLVIRNESDEKLENLQLKIKFDPDFAREYCYDIQAIEAGESLEIGPVKIVLSTEFLFSLSEKIVGSILIELYENDMIICERADVLDLLAYNEWPGQLSMPELIAAFVTPNHPLISEILTKATRNLERWGKQPSITGYIHKDPNLVKLQMAAIYTALLNEGINYVIYPIGFEKRGGKVRLPHEVLTEKKGCCHDLSVLYAACLEAAGLHPLIVYIKEHAFVGCWLEEKTFADCVVDDVSALEKRVVAGSEEIILLESTMLCIGVESDFENAVKYTKNHLQRIDDFYYVVDIKRTRGSGIKPMPVHKEQVSAEEFIEEHNAHSYIERKRAPEDLNLIQMEDLSKKEEKLTKQKIWERKLLDFSLRNTLLSFRVNKNSLQLMVSDLSELEDRLSDGKDFSVLEMPPEWKVTMRDAKIFEVENNRSLIESIVAEEFKNHRIRTFLSETELTQNLKNMYRAAKVSMEENGTNTLFLALGFLRWYETDKAEKPRYAPIVLVPIDIVKSRRNKGYVIRSRQEDAQINITLLEYLRQIYEVKINGLDPLPADEHGIDLPLVFHTIRQAIMGKKRWNIENMAFMGLFSFGQFVMWNDIRNRSKELEANKVVSSLIEGKMNWIPKEREVTLDNLDTVVEPHKMAIPLSADSSQMVAIAAAAGGQSFVLHGPPGTGKSQTITNMIANALYQGKSVLFVAEKMAALNVVQNRLASIGLDPFCLELHSNKTNKSNVLKQLNQALEVGRIKSPEQYQETADKIYELRKELNKVVEALHCKRSYGCTLYEAIEKFESTKEQKGKILFSQETIVKSKQETIAKWQDVLRQYIVSLNEVPTYKNSAFKEYEGTSYSIEIRDDLESTLNELISRSGLIKESIDVLSKWTAIEKDQSRTTLNEFVQLSQILTDEVPVLKELLLSANYSGISRQIRELCQSGIDYNNMHEEISSEFEKQVFDYNASDAALRLKQAEMSWALPKMLGKNKLVKEMKLYAKNPSAITADVLPVYFEKLMNYHLLKEKVEQVSGEISEKMNGLYMGKETDWQLVLDAAAKAENIYKFVKSVSPEKQTFYIEAAANFAKQKQITAAVKNVSIYLSKISKLEKRHHINFKETETNPEWVAAVTEILERFAEHLSELKNWVTMLQKAEAMKEAGLANVVSAWENENVNVNDMQNAFECNLYFALILKTIREDVRLQEFQGRQYEDMISKYGELIEKFRALTIQELVAKLSAQIPVTGTVNAASSEVGILKRAIKSNGRMLSIRKLFEEIPTLLRKICPCMLMSPISVAQYIDPAFPKFDLVIFDEASQLPTSEAVGTIARGENVVVVGDPNQLPPTSFFNANRVDEENIDKEDLESLLDDCLSISMPQEYLKWHYRSRHESLIAYSNMKYYDNKLYTFPSPNDLVSEVKLVPVEGYYDKGKTKQNRAEAEAVVHEIIRRLEDKKLRNDSIGVVTFSSVQQHLIEDLLSEEFVKYPELEDFDRASKEPLFIKNLENVQGDERDVILFSIGYGPDKEGKVSMNFGPLNREGGWRRLNVAISRARKSMIVYSTLRPEQIDLSRTRAEGIVGLKGFLEFAARGKNALVSRANTSKHADAFVIQLADAIKQMGYDVKCNIGCSAYKMDIGIVNAENPDTYCLGILLDGENCREAATSKDRFILQPSVLKGLGWKIMRVWTLEWLDNPEKVLEEIRAEIERSKQVQIEEPEQTNELPKEEIVFEKEDVTQLENFKGRRENYNSFEVPIISLPEHYYESETQYKIAELVTKILKAEAPISKNVLLRKVISAWGITRTGTRVERRFNSAMKAVEKRETKDLDNTFYWRADQNPEEYIGYRVEDQYGNKRSIEDISSHEITNAMVEVLYTHISLTKSDLIKETAKKFGYSRMGNVLETTIVNAITRASRRKIIAIKDGEKVTLV